MPRPPLLFVYWLPKHPVFWFTLTQSVRPLMVTTPSDLEMEIVIEILIKWFFKCFCNTFSRANPGQCYFLKIYKIRQ